MYPKNTKTPIATTTQRNHQNPILDPKDLLPKSSEIHQNSTFSSVSSSGRLSPPTQPRSDGGQAHAASRSVLSSGRLSTVRSGAPGPIFLLYPPVGGSGGRTFRSTRLGLRNVPLKKSKSGRRGRFVDFFEVFYVFGPADFHGGLRLS